MSHMDLVRNKEKHTLADEMSRGRRRTMLILIIDGLMK